MVAERFLLGGELGTGGMATVYAAEDQRLRRDVALKILHPHLRDQEDVLSRFRSEARAVASLKHPHIVEVYDVAPPDDAEAYMVAERIWGTTLRKLVRAVGPFPPEVAASVLLDVLSGLQVAHEAGMVHRDIKPENVMIAGIADDGQLLPGRDIRVKVMDFGVAKWSGASGMTVTGQMLGSPAHMAPEQIDGGSVDARTDVFACSILFYELLTGELPFRGASPAQSFHRILSGMFEPADAVRPAIGRRWARLVGRGLALAPADRFQSAEGFAVQLRAECTRLGAVEEGRLARYLADPAAYQKEHHAPLVSRLCALGAEAHAARDFVAAADDINRAAAIAPEDEKVMALLARLARTRRHASQRRTGALVACGTACALLLGAALWWARAQWKPAALLPPASRDMVVTDNAGALQRGVDAVASTSDNEREAERATPVAAEARVAPTVRAFRIVELSPSAGVLMSVDGAEPVPVSRGYALQLSTGAHELKYSCVQDMCVPWTHNVARGTKAVSSEVRLGIRPATLLVEGDPTHSYSAVERPSLGLRAGVTASVPMSQGTLVLTVVQDASGSRRDVVLRAGKTATVRF